MIRTEQEEFFIEPVERGDGVIEEEEEGGGGGRTHIVYRSSAVKKASISSEAADFHARGQSVARTVPCSASEHPSQDASRSHSSPNPLHLNLNCKIKGPPLHILNPHNYADLSSSLAKFHFLKGIHVFCSKFYSIAQAVLILPQTY